MMRVMWGKKGDGGFFEGAESIFFRWFAPKLRLGGCSGNCVLTRGSAPRPRRLHPIVFGTEKFVLEARWQGAVNAESPLLPHSSREVQLSITDPAEVCHPSSHPSLLLSRTLASTDRASVSRCIIREDGFGGWWSPTDSSFGFLQVAGMRIDLLVTSLWDGAPDGRMGTITACAPARDRAHVRDFFREIDPITCVADEAQRGWWRWATRRGDPEPPVSSSLCVLLSRFTDNIYIYICI